MEKCGNVSTWQPHRILRSPGGEAGLLKDIHLFFIVKMQSTERTSVFLHLDLGTQHCRMQKGDSVRRTPRREHSHAGGIQTQLIFGLEEVLNHTMS